MRWIAWAAVFVSAGALAQSRPMGLAAQLSYNLTLDSVPSPDGKSLLYIRVIEGREQLFVMDVDGRNERQITRDPAHHEDPAWSPDGRRIAFVQVIGEAKRLAIMNADGSGTELVTPPGQRVLHPAWAPDGRTILYSTDDDLRPPAKNAAAIYAIELATKRIRTVIEGGVNTYPVMSPDAKRIAFRKIVGEMNSEVFVADADGTNLRNLTDHHAWEGWPAWSPDGRHIAFAGNRNSAYQIFVMDAEGGGVRLLANTEGRATAPRWSVDGKRIFFTNCQAKDFGRSCDILSAEFRP